jgi:hypothetical protein
MTSCMLVAVWSLGCELLQQLTAHSCSTAYGSRVPCQMYIPGTTAAVCLFSVVEHMLMRGRGVLPQPHCCRTCYFPYMFAPDTVLQQQQQLVSIHISPVPRCAGAVVGWLPVLAVFPAAQALTLLRLLRVRNVLQDLLSGYASGTACFLLLPQWRAQVRLGPARVTLLYTETVGCHVLCSCVRIV